MPAAARVNDMVYVDDPDRSTDYGAILVGSPNVWINEGNASPVRISVPAATAAAQSAALDDFITNPTKYQQPPEAIKDDQIKQNYAGTPDTSDYKMAPPPDPDNPAPPVPPPNESGNKWSFVGGNQSVKSFTNNPSGGGVTNSYPSGWTTSKGQIVSVIRPNNSGAIIPLLDSHLADKMAWLETGMGGAPSNTKITNIWKELGMPRTAFWENDQTAWCAGFVNYILKKSGLKWRPEAGARNVIANARAIDATVVSITDMQPGDIVLWSYSHVNFVYRRFS